MRDKCAGQNVAFNDNQGAVMHDRTIDACQYVKTYRRPIPAVRLHVLDIFQQFAAVLHRGRVAKAVRRAVAVLNVMRCCGAIFLTLAH